MLYFSLKTCLFIFVKKVKLQILGLLAIQIIRETLGGGGLAAMSPSDTRFFVTWHFFGEKMTFFTVFEDIPGQFYVTRVRGGPHLCHQMTHGEGGQKKCHVLFEWPLVMFKGQDRNHNFFKFWICFFSKFWIEIFFLGMQYRKWIQIPHPHSPSFSIWNHWDSNDPLLYNKRKIIVLTEKKMLQFRIG